MNRLTFLAVLAAAWPAPASAQSIPADASLVEIHADEEERDRRENVAAVIAALEIKPGDTVADIGAGYGYYASRISPVVGERGKVVAEEIDGPLVERLRRRIRVDRLNNVEPILGSADDPNLSRYRFDAIVLGDVYHEIGNPVEFLKKLRGNLKGDGRLIVIDYLKPEHANASRERQRQDHNIAPIFVEEDLKAAGFRIIERKENFATGYDNIPLYYVLAGRR
jgi:protein-L-isoaspartate O-methyltransferase